MSPPAARDRHIDPSKLALLVVNVQMAFAQFDAEGRARSTPQAEENIRACLTPSARAAG